MLGLVSGKASPRKETNTKGSKKDITVACFELVSIYSIMSEHLGLAGGLKAVK